MGTMDGPGDFAKLSDAAINQIVDTLLVSDNRELMQLLRDDDMFQRKVVTVTR